MTLSRSLIVPFLRVFAAPRPARAGVPRLGGAGRERRARPTTARSSAEMLALRAEQARLLGYPDFATYKLEPQMAKTPEAVRELLMAVWAPARAQAEADAGRLEELMRADGVNGPLEPWDWRYYAAIRRAARARPRRGGAEAVPCSSTTSSRAAFDVAGRLFGLSFHPIEAALYHPDARAWEVRRGERHVGVFIGDYFARPSKRSGAWCTTFRDQRKLDGEVRPIAVNVCNFAKAPDGRAEPADLRRRAHALPRVGARAARAAVGRDLRVHLGHQRRAGLRGAAEPALRALAGDAGGAGGARPPRRDRRADAARPDGAADRGAELRHGLRDGGVPVARRWSTSTSTPGRRRPTRWRRRRRRWRELGMPAAIVMRHATPHFQHVFAGEGYSAGLLFLHVVGGDGRRRLRRLPRDRATCSTRRRRGGWRTSILSAGGSREAAELYTAFRGRMPGVEALLEQRGLKAA